MNKMRILVAYDGSSYADAALTDLRRAGLPREAEAVVISVAEVWTWLLSNGEDDGAPAQELDIIRLKEARAQAAQIVERARTLAARASARVQAMFPEWAVHAEAYGDSPAWAVIKKADEWAADLIVLGSRGRSALRRHIFGTVSQKVLYEARCSVRIARRPARKGDSPMRILVGVDGSPGAEAAVDAVAARTWPAGSEARVITAHSPLTPLAFRHVLQPRAVAAGECADDKRTSAQNIADVCAEKLRAAGLAASAIVREGDPKRVLLDEAENWGADSIFVGARGLGSVGRFLLGSVSAA
ncbi:MAG TPA: universal stress protein, partial [Blastocatellia bacterium]|nr:universal stress protein [Blastocatellia bacterium]